MSLIQAFSDVKTPFYFFDLAALKSERDAVVEWLEQLGYGAESRRKVRVRGSASPCGDWKTLSTQQ